MQPSQSTNPQLGPAMALVALRSEFPHLPPAKWSLDRDGHLMGTVYDPDVFAAYVDLFGETPTEAGRSVRNGVIRETQQLFATWRDVEVSLWMLCIVGTVPTPMVVAA